MVMNEQWQKEKLTEEQEVSEDRLKTKPSDSEPPELPPVDDDFDDDGGFGGNRFMVGVVMRMYDDSVLLTFVDYETYMEPNNPLLDCFNPLRLISPDGLYDIRAGNLKACKYIPFSKPNFIVSIPKEDVQCCTFMCGSGMDFYFKWKSLLNSEELTLHPVQFHPGFCPAMVIGKNQQVALGNFQISSGQFIFAEGLLDNGAEPPDDVSGVIENNSQQNGTNNLGVDREQLLDSMNERFKKKGESDTEGGTTP